jgi:hypothetical protein
MVTISQNDRDILCRLAEQKAMIAALPVQQERRREWSRMNRNVPGKPMLWVNEICWHEMDVDGELTLQTRAPFARKIEAMLRQELYMWRHLQGDMVVEPVMTCPLVINDSAFGISEDVDTAKTDPASGIVSRHFHVQISKEADIEKIRMPVVQYDAAQTLEREQAIKSIFEGILPVARRGAPGFWFAPWDELIRWTGVSEAMMDLIERPEYMHAVLERLTAAYLCKLDQYEQQNLLSLNNTACRVGSGGYGVTDEIPLAGYDSAHVRPGDLWGCGTAQIFSDVSPDMHWEFALQYEIRWMRRFALNYYGCCEPLHNKLDVLARIPNLRKVSMSPWADLGKAMEKAGRRYVWSLKPSPAILAEDRWRPDAVREELRRKLEALKGQAVEVILKDISTVRYQPRRLWEWVEIAREVTAEYC